jgi:hypothetical protein
VNEVVHATEILLSNAKYIYARCLGFLRQKVDTDTVRLNRASYRATVSSAFIKRANHGYLFFGSRANRNALKRSMFAMVAKRRASSILIASLISLSRCCSRSKIVSASARWLSSIIVPPA